MHIYAFGSLCRGEVLASSDIDLLAVVEGYDRRFNPNLFSIYSYKRIAEIWKEGNPFAWHLHLEAKEVFFDDGSDYLKSLGKPANYDKAAYDCLKFYRLFEEARSSLDRKSQCVIFDLAAVFLAVRNFATCFSLGMLQAPDFSRSSAVRLGERSVPIDEEQYSILERARLLCTRGAGECLTRKEVEAAMPSLPTIDGWMKALMQEVHDNG